MVSHNAMHNPKRSTGSAQIVPISEAEEATQRREDSDGAEVQRIRKLSGARSLSESAKKYVSKKIPPSRRNSRHLSMQEEVSKLRARLKNSNNLFALEPHSRRMRQWDGVTFMALIFTAVVTPVEVAFTNASRLQSHEIPIFIINRLVDLIFTTDMVLQFFVAYYDESLGGILVKSRSLIAQRYLRGWFLIDFVSLLPFDLINSLDTSAGSLNFLKSLRLLRLLKLFRVIRASRILARWEAAAVLTRVLLSRQHKRLRRSADLRVFLCRDKYVQILLQVASLRSLECVAAFVLHVSNPCGHRCVRMGNHCPRRHHRWLDMDIGVRTTDARA